VLAITLGFVAPAEAGVRTFRPGVAITTLPTEGELAASRAIRAQSIRVAFSWDAIETRRRTGSSCFTAVYNFDRYDALVSEAGQRDLSILPVLGGSPEYVEPGSGATNASRYPAPGTRAFGDFQCFVRALVGRYGRRGTFRARDIIEWQIWNEPNLVLFSPNRRVSPSKYGQLVKATAGSIRSRDGRATIVLAGLPEAVSRPNMNAHVFLRKLYKVNKIRSKFDAAALHPYARNARGTKGGLIRFRETLKDLGDGRRPVWVTEVGYATHGPKGHFAVTSEQGQADKLQSTLEMLRKNRKRFKLGTVHWYSFRDTATYAQNTGNWTQYAGLYFKDGSPKPACTRYKRFTGVAGACTRIQDGSSTLPLASSGGFEPGPEAPGAAQILPSAPEPPQE
jgi:hypothetical protein